MSDDITSMILADVTIIAHIYTIIKNAGINTISKKSIKDNQDDVCISKVNDEGSNRFTCKASNNYSILYDANDIMIVGGAALNIYDYLLSDLKMRKEFGELEKYIKKKTSDIDIVWWPRSVHDKKGNFIDKDIVVSKSNAIVELANQLKNELDIMFNQNRELLSSKIKKYITNAKVTDILHFSIGLNQVIPAGVWNITISFKIKEQEYKLCDIIIHDSGSSQQYDFNGNEINTLQFMTNDPIYCSPKQGHNNSISYLNVNGIDIAVPNIQSFVKQQMLAFNNLIDKRELTKGFINYKRVQFIKNILSSLNIVDSKNKIDLLEVFKTDNIYYPQLIINEINYIENASIKRLSNKILKLCKTNISDDDIIKDLCNKASLMLKQNETITKQPANSKTIDTSIKDAEEIKKNIDRELGILPKKIGKNKSNNLRDHSLKHPYPSQYRQQYQPQYRQQYQSQYRQQYQPQYRQQYPSSIQYSQPVYQSPQTYPIYTPTSQTFTTNAPTIHYEKDLTWYRDPTTGVMMSLGRNGQWRRYSYKGGIQRNITRKRTRS